jgi:Flp pilus assembly protein TadG
MRRGRGERGQILPVVTLALIALLGISAFAIDVGYAYYAKRQLQSATDAAALAGAQDLPTAATAIATATSYAAANTPTNVSATFTYATRCTATAAAALGSCNASANPNALTVTATGSTNTFFAKIFGISHFDVSAKANACSPCSSSPVDVVVVIDRTGSMCDTTTSAGCTDLNNAKDGVHTLLGMLNPPYAQVGLIAFPPLPSVTSSVCSAPEDTSSDYTAYDSADRRYVDDHIGSDYRLSTGAANPNSGLYLHTTEGDRTKCVIPAGYTSYSEALRQAKKELDDYGRPSVPDVIVFLTDGEANIGSVYASDGHQFTDAVNGGVAAFPDNSPYPPGNPDDQQPCHTAENLAASYKAAGVTIYSIGYALGTNKECTHGTYGPWIAKVPAVAAVPPTYNKKGKMTDPGSPGTPEIPAHWCDRDSTALVVVNGTTVVEKNQCKHSSGGSAQAESPTIYSDDTVENIASAGAFYNKSAAGDLSTIFAAIATDIGAGSSRLVDDSY